MKLRKNFLAKAGVNSEKYTKSNNKRWLTYAFVPVLAILLVVGVALLPNSGSREEQSPLNKFQPKRVSANELIANAQEYESKFDPSNYSFVIAQRESKRGPLFDQCTMGGGMGLEASTENVYSYVYDEPGSDNVRATFFKITSEGAVTSEDSQYYKSSNESGFDGQILSSVDEFLSGYQVGGVPSYSLTDINGVPLPDNQIVSSVRADGSEVFDFVLKLNPEKITVECEEIIHVVIDANTYTVLEHNTYSGSIAPERLIVENTEQKELLSVNEKEAIKVMSDAGFDVSKIEL